MNAMSGLRPPSGLSGFGRAKYSSLVSRSSCDVVAELDLEVERGVHAERRAVREREAVPVPQADLEVGARADGLVQAGEEVEVLHAQNPTRYRR